MESKGLVSALLQQLLSSCMAHGAHAGVRSRLGDGGYW